MDRDKAKVINKEIADALGPIAQRHNLKLVLRGGSYDATSFRPKFELHETTPTGRPKQQEEDFRQYATVYGLDPTDLGRKFVSGTKTYTIAGLKMNAHVRPIVATDNTGRTFVFEAQIVKAYLSNKR